MQKEVHLPITDFIRNKWIYKICHNYTMRARYIAKQNKKYKRRSTEKQLEEREDREEGKEREVVLKRVGMGLPYVFISFLFSFLFYLKYMKNGSLQKNEKKSVI